MLNLYQVLDYYQTHNVPMQIGMWGVTAPGDLAAYTSPDVAALQADLVSHLYLAKNFREITHYTGLNEPNVTNDAKKYVPANWADATTALNAAFSRAGLPTQLIAGPDSAEATISAQNGDLGLESVSGPAAKADQNIDWHADRLTSFSAMFYTDKQLPPAVKFWTSGTANGPWTELDAATLDISPEYVTVATNPWWQFQARSKVPLPAGVTTCASSYPRPRMALNGRSRGSSWRSSRRRAPTRRA